MSGLTYREQLLHPRWQRKRLGVLERDGWMCMRCCADDKTLQVHHKRYVKGRMAWEYPDDELISLCSDCHHQTHEEKDALLAEIAQSGHLQGELAHLIRGYSFCSLDRAKSASAFEAGSAQFRAGMVAAACAVLEPKDAARVLSLAEELFRIDYQGTGAIDAESNPS